MWRFDLPQSICLQNVYLVQRSMRCRPADTAVRLSRYIPSRQMMKYPYPIDIALDFGARATLF